MALALLPPYESSRSLQPPLPSSNFLVASGAMDQANKVRPSLPSISSLLEHVSEQSVKGNASTPTFDPVRRISGGSHGHGISPDRPKIAGSPRSLPPPTPEFLPTSNFDFARPSPANTSPGIASSRNGYHQSTNPELYAQRPSSYPSVTEPTTIYPSSAESNSWPTHFLRRVPDAAHQDRPLRPLAAPASDGQGEGPVFPGLSQQRPLPTDFPGPLPGISLRPIDPSLAPTWQHHHYYPPANPPSYPQTQERYICPTCSKPFSRPSSLKIHTYSHTGEKPYKCKHEGCGKYFSVRSNMKRHEKGCHGGETVGAAKGPSPRTNS
jgi:uncharacterized Zn-finger protein